MQHYILVKLVDILFVLVPLGVMIFGMTRTPMRGVARERATRKPISSRATDDSR